MAIADTAMLDKSFSMWTRTRTRRQTIRMGSSGKKSRVLGFLVLWEADSILLVSNYMRYFWGILPLETVLELNRILV
jgi:hypothetical protein